MGYILSHHILTNVVWVIKGKNYKMEKTWREKNPFELVWGSSNQRRDQIGFKLAQASGYQGYWESTVMQNDSDIIKNRDWWYRDQFACYLEVRETTVASSQSGFGTWDLQISSQVSCNLFQAFR